jgi:Ca2+-binding EF-hand superfamily protein
LEEGIEYEDFLRVTIHRNKILNEENLKAAFDMFDIKKEGSISAEGLKNVLCGERQVADDVVKEFLSEIHKNPEEKISYKEFTNLMCDNFNYKFVNSIDSYLSSSKEEILLTEGSSESIDKILNTK